MLNVDLRCGSGFHPIRPETGDVRQLLNARSHILTDRQSDKIVEASDKSDVVQHEA